jgi:hypothetical protein
VSSLFSAQAEREGPVPDAPVFTYQGPFLDAACPIQISCRWEMSNPLLPIVSAAMDVQVVNGVFTPQSPNTDTSNLCNSFVAMPNFTDVQFIGLWTPTAINGTWGSATSAPSIVSPPDLLLANLAVISTGGPISVSGTTTVTSVDGRQFQGQELYNYSV